MILDTIAASTAKRVANAKKTVLHEAVRKLAISLPRGEQAFEKALRKPGISFICEIKKASPSKGVIAEDFPYLNIAREYEAAGAAAISVLTEPDFFQGSDTCLREISNQVSIPVLRKDFTIDEYQIYEAKVLGADAVLLICALLDVKTLSRYIGISKNLGLSALVEAHTSHEIDMALAAGAEIIGVNNRDLKTFEVNLNTCVELRAKVPDGILFIAESGIRTADDMELLRKAKVDAVLIGEALMRSSDKKAVLQELS